MKGYEVVSLLLLLQRT